MAVFSDIIAESMYPAMLDTFGDSVTYQPRAGESYTLTCVLDSGEAVQASERVYQTAWAPLSSFTGGEPVRGDSVTVDSVTYRVADIERQHFDGRLLKLVVTSAQ